MFKSWKKITALNRVSQTMDYIYRNMEELSVSINRGDRSERMKRKILGLVFIGKKGIDERVNEYSIPVTGGINVPSFGFKKIPFQQVYFKTVSQVRMMAHDLGFHEEIDSIVEKRDLYQWFENNLSDEERRAIGKL